MKRIAMSLTIALSAAAAPACQKADSEGNAKVLAKLDAIEKRLDQLAAQRPAPGVGAPQARRAALDPNTVYSVPLRDGELTRGAKNAKVTIVEAYEYACPYCQQVAGAIDKVVETRGADVKVVSRQLVVHPQVATAPALGLCAAVKQGKGTEYEHEIWKRAWLPAEKGARLDQTQLAQEALDKIAADLKLDAAQFKADAASPACKQQLEQGRAAMAQVGVNGTPAFFINGRPYQGPRTFEGFNAAIDAEIARADEAMKKVGLKAEDYYAHLMKDAKKTP